MSNPIHVILLLALVFVWLGPAILAGNIADRKGRSLPVYLLAGLIVGPLVLLIVPRHRKVA